MHRFLPFFILILLISVAFFYQPARREIAYKLNISGDITESCCNASNLDQISGKFDENANVAIFENQIFDFPKTSLAQMTPPVENSDVLGTTNSEGAQKWIEVSLSQQKLRAWEGNKIVMEFPISSGRWYPTPKGDFSIWAKTRYQRMTGGSKDLGTYYDLPNVPANMFFFKDFAIHGAYWHNNFGQPMSHGCVNAPLSSAAQLFEWTGPVITPGKNIAKATSTNPGTRVFIH